jgi:hypothetical protein
MYESPRLEACWREAAYNACTRLDMSQEGAWTGTDIIIGWKARYACEGISGSRVPRTSGPMAPIHRARQAGPQGELHVVELGH